MHDCYRPQRETGMEATGMEACETLAAAYVPMVDKQCYVAVLRVQHGVYH